MCAREFGYLEQRLQRLYDSIVPGMLLAVLRPVVGGIAQYDGF